MIYFIDDNHGAIKVGYSRDVHARVATIQTTFAKPISLIGHIDGEMAGERFMHSLLQDFRLNGEWFSDCSEVRNLIAKVIAEGLAALGFVQSEWDAEETELDSIRTAKLLAAVVLQHSDRAAGETLRDFALRLSAGHSLSPGLLWSLQYRPPKDLYMTDYQRLISAALKATEAGARRLLSDAALVDDIVSEILRCDHEIVAVEAALNELFARRAGPASPAVAAAKAVAGEEITQ